MINDQNQNSGGKFMRQKALVILAMTLVLATSAWASSETILYNFNSFTGDGYEPYSGLVADAKGNLYGTTQTGGANYGTVFELKLSGGTYTEIQLHIFTAGVSDGAYPQYSSLVFDKAGNLYGTTYQGGTYNVGTVFELHFSGGKWNESIIHSFAGYPKDGSYPQAGLSLDAAGNLYGTTYYGGASNVGTVFQLMPSKGKWTYKKIHSFAGGNGGEYPYGGITPGANGYYYGTTEYGGTTYNAGTVYRLFESRGVWVAQSVFIFPGAAGVNNPDSSLTLDAAGNFYGTTYQGGASNYGTVYKLKPGKNNKYTQSVLYSFKAGNTDGDYPWYGSGVAVDVKGNLYGTTRYGSQYNEGTVWELKNTTGKYKEIVLHTFADTSSNDGYDPLAGVILFKNKLYGTTYLGGTHGYGTVFEVTP
jgi:uncharacterized repeat protein (TIGR03803 family)